MQKQCSRPSWLELHLTSGCQDEKELKSTLGQVVRSLVGPIATPRDILIVDRLPKTRSGKILRGTIRVIADNKHFDTESLHEFGQRYARRYLQVVSEGKER